MDSVKIVCPMVLIPFHSGYLFKVKCRIWPNYKKKCQSLNPFSFRVFIQSA